MIEFASLPLRANVGLLAAGAVAVWLAGTRLSIAAERLTKRTRLTEAYAGLVLLAVATSLPELATSLTASLSGNAELATSNLVGGVAMQTAVLAIADAVGFKGALTYVTPSPVLLMQGVLLILLLALVIVGGASSSAVSVFGVGAATVGVALSYAVGLYILRSHQSHPRWKVVDPPEAWSSAVVADPESPDAPSSNGGIRKPVRSFALASIVVLVGGWLVASTADAVAVQTGIGATFIGATLLAFASSLPELSTTIQAVRQGAYRMAISNIFGSNAIDVALVFAADLCYRNGPVLAEMSQALLFTAGLAIVLTCVYLVGLLERRNRAIARMGWDSAAVLVLYTGGVWVLYGLSS